MAAHGSEGPIFADLDNSFCDYDSSRVVVLPVPLERTTSYGRGTAQGPRAILEASAQVELYDQELRGEPYRIGIHTSRSLPTAGIEHAECLDHLATAVERLLRADKFVLALGGEHSLSQAPVRAAKKVYGELGVIQFDAHADLRDRYEGSPLSHACVMRRIAEIGVASLAVGIRSLSGAEARWIDERRLPVIWGHELTSLGLDRFRRALRALPDRVYLTFDVDFFDPSVVPATGTPEPGGGLWYPTLELLRTLFEEKDVVAMDLVELAPISGQPASDFAAARLAYKCIGYLGEGTSRR